MRKLIKLQYVNHINEVVDIGNGGIYAGSSDLRDYVWTVNQRGKRISSLTREVVTRRLPLIITAPTVEESYQIRNRLFEIAEKDVLAMQPGKLICGGYYYSCYVTKSEKPSYWKDERTLVVELTLTTDRPVWIKESTYSFTEKSSRAAGSDGEDLDYPYDYPHDYTSGVNTQILKNPGFVGTNFRIIIYGVCENPQIIINEHTYKLNATAEAGEYIVIDSYAKTIYKVSADGSKTNIFSSRDKSSYIFEPISPGANSVTWNGTFAFDVIILEERSEPKWI